jgi:hypothetical protein
LKSLIDRTLRTFGYELCRLNGAERQLVADWKPGEELNYKDVQLVKGISAPGHITIEEARFLRELVQQTAEDELIIEIGTLFGFSTMIMALAKSPTQPLITVDNYSWNPLGMTPAAHELATRLALEDVTRTANVQVMRADKNAFYREFDRSRRVGLFFCDADHSYEATKADLLWAKEIGARIVCGHDYDPIRHAGVTRAVDSVGGPRQICGSLFVV